MLEKAPKFEKRENTIEQKVTLEMLGILKPIQDEYLYWDKVKYKKTQLSPEELWTVVKFDRWLRSKPVTFGRYKFSYYATEYIQKLLHHFDLHIGGILGSNIGIAETDKTKFVINSIMEEAISSSQMEGANTTRKVAKEMIQKERKPKNKSEQMIMNNFLTMRHIVQHKSDDLTSETLLNIHRLISNNTLDEKAEEGVFRNNNEIFVANHSTDEIVHTPPLHVELSDLINDLCKFFNEEGSDFIHPIIKGIIIHFMIGWIHPFTDGNGRTARALFYWYMLKKGYWLTEYLSISRIIKDTKIQYEKAYLYSEMDDNDLSYFITYHVKTMEKAFEALKVYIGLKQREVMQAAKFAKIPGVNERMAQLLKIIYEDADRIFSPKEVENRFNISSYTARADLKQLVELGFMEVIQVNKIKQSFIRSSSFEEVLGKYNIGK